MARLRAIHIDAVNLRVREITIGGLEDMQKAVGGYIEVACHLPNGDCVFVDEEGLLKEPEDFFTIKGGHQPFAGSGLVLGGTDEDGNSLPVKSTLREIDDAVQFLSIADVAALFRDPSAS